MKTWHWWDWVNPCIKSNMWEMLIMEKRLILHVLNMQKDSGVQQYSTLLYPSSVSKMSFWHVIFQMLKRHTFIIPERLIRQEATTLSSHFSLKLSLQAGVKCVGSGLDMSVRTNMAFPDERTNTFRGFHGNWHEVKHSLTLPAFQSSKARIRQDI